MSGRTANIIIQTADGTLQARKLSCGATASRKLAVIAHPLGRLGGSMDDPVVSVISRTLLSQGYDVLQYNARGVGQSSGRASISSMPEASDYQHVVDTHATDLDELLCCGYSAGAMAASLASGPTGIRTRHLLVAYPWSVLWALTGFRAAPFVAGLEALVRRPDADVLAIYGDTDEFTGVSKYQRLFEMLSDKADPSARFTAVVIEGADHFFRGNSSRALADRVREWIESRS